MNEQSHFSGPDHESDPAHTPGSGWVDEGGASHLGPATHLTHEHAHEHEHAHVEVEPEGEDSDQ